MTQPTSSPTPIRIILADDHEMVLEGFSMILEDEPDIQVIGTALDGKQLIARLETQVPDVLVLDYQMPVMDGLGALQHVRAHHPELPVILLSSHGEGDKIKATFDAGASAYILKNKGRSELVKAIREVAAGGVYFPPEVMRALSKATQGASARALANTQVKVTPRELEVLRLHVEGLPAKLIADRLCIAKTTVDTHLKSLMEKLGADNGRMLVRIALDRHLLDG